MRVSDLSRFLESLSGPLEAAGAKRAAGDLEQVCRALGPFGEMPIPQFADFLLRAEEYARTGVVPTQAKGTKASKAADEGKVKQAAEELAQLYGRATLPETTYAEIQTRVDQAGKRLSKDESVRVAKELGISEPLRTKKAALQAIHDWIARRKQSFERVQF